MKESYVARQPIHDRALRVVGYELLFRGSQLSLSAGGNGDEATSRTLLTALTEIGLEPLVGRRKAYVNVTRSFLLDGHARVCPPDRFVLEVLEDVVVDAELLATLRVLRSEGYAIALDDFVYRDELRPLLDLAEVVKLDVLAHGDRLPEQVELLRPFDVRLLAEKVETHEAMELCSDLGFELFQGFFFCRPRTVTGRGISASRLTRLQLLSSLNDPDLELEELARIVECDVALSYRLLRYVNSTYVGLAQPVDSIRKALVLLGVQTLRAWASLFVLAQMGEAPVELRATAMARARMCERVAPELGLSPQTAFTAGLFTVIDALMDQEMEAVLEELPLSDVVKAALLRHEGDLGALLGRVLAYEAGTLPSDGASLCGPYLEAIAWADQVSGAVQAD
jgi:EAL and modified HD-GYP domain-containing signal transduction protein